MFNNTPVPFSFYTTWMIVFLGFPIGGLITQLVLGSISDVPRGVIGGFITGAVIGLAQWFVLRSTLGVSPIWIAVTAIGMGIGLGIGIATMGISTEGNTSLIRGAITGLIIGFAQFLVLRSLIPNSGAWIIAISLAWAIGWFVTRGIGVDVEKNYSVFGSSGAIAFQFLTGIVWWILLR